MHDEMIKEISKKGGRIDAIYYCPGLTSQNVIVSQAQKCLKMLT